MMIFLFVVIKYSMYLLKEHIVLSVLSIRYIFYLELTSVHVVRVKDPVPGFSRVGPVAQRHPFTRLVGHK